MVIALKTLITNLRGQCLFDASVKTGADALISIHEGRYRRNDLDSFLKGGEILIENETPQEACEKILGIIKGAKIHGEVFVAAGSGVIGPFLTFVANLEGVDGLYFCYNDKVIRIPPLKLDISKRRLNILDILSKGDSSAIEIGENLGISRAMVYKHLNRLIDMGLVKRSHLYEKYSITKAGNLAIIINRVQ